MLRVFARSALRATPRASFRPAVATRAFSEDVWSKRETAFEAQFAREQEVEALKKLAATLKSAKDTRIDTDPHLEVMSDKSKAKALEHIAELEAEISKIKAQLKE